MSAPGRSVEEATAAAAQFVAAFFAAEQQQDAQRPLCDCGWNGEGTTVHCAFCHRTDPVLGPDWHHLHEVHDGVLVAVPDPNPPQPREP